MKKMLMVFSIFIYLVSINPATPAAADTPGEPCIAFDLQLSRSGLTPAHREELKSRYLQMVKSLNRMHFLIGDERSRTLQKYGIFSAGEINQRAAAMMVARTPVKWYMTAGVAAEPGNMAAVYVLLDDRDPTTRWISYQKTVTTSTVPHIAAALEKLLEKINDPLNDQPGR